MKNNMTEDDTYNALRRIPWHDLLERTRSLTHFCVGHEVRRREEALANAAELRKYNRMKWLKPFLGAQAVEPIYLNTTINLDTSVTRSALDGTGWIYEDYMAEINKIVDAIDAEALSKKRKKYGLIGALCFLALFLNVVVTLLFGPVGWLSEIFIGLVNGVISGSLYSILEEKLDL